MITMLLGGLWHGASWNFVAWGGLHGVYLLINHGWNALTKGNNAAPQSSSSTISFMATGFTFLVVVFGWVLFRAESFPAAMAIFKGMAGVNGLAVPVSVATIIPNHEWIQFRGVFYMEGAVWTGGAISTFLALLALSSHIVWFTPNVREMFLSHTISPQAFVPSVKWGIGIGLLLCASITKLGETSEFLYFQF